MVDSLSLVFLLLSTFLLPLVVVTYWEKITQLNYRRYLLTLISLEVILVIAFTTADLFIFYVCLEMSLVPILFLVGFWGDRSRKIKAIFYFVLYMTVSSVCIIIVLITLYLCYSTSSLYLYELLNYQILLINNINFSLSSIV